MPVFTRVRDGVLVLTVDGDYTTNELRRVALGAFEAEATPPTVPVLLDLSGAAGLKGKSEEDLRATGAVFAEYRDRVARIGVVAADEVHDRFAPDGAFGSEAGVAIRACRSHADARTWLSERAAP
jgi:hypothetical protein